MKKELSSSRKLLMLTPNKVTRLRKGKEKATAPIHSAGAL
jgi:hypothetical protein